MKPLSGETNNQPTTQYLLGRRSFLAHFGTVAAVSILRSGGLCAENVIDPVTALGEGREAKRSGSCIVTPEQTEGPYFLDEQLNRSDIRVDPSSGMMSSGTPLRIGLSISQNNPGMCTPLRGAIVDVWHCDASGIYSGVTDLNGYFRSEGKKFLRGYQVTDGNGMVHFLTIYPGWYSGRTVHIHVKIRATLSTRSQYEFTSQLYFDEAVTDAVHMQPAYAKRGRRTTLNHMDGIFRRAGNQLILPVTRDEGAYTGIFHIGLKM